ncbi:MAG: PD-(D/E)XK nuclease family protein [Promethearchaeota archaeon]
MNEKLIKMVLDNYIKALLRKEAFNGHRKLELNEFRASSVWECSRKLFFKKIFPEKDVELNDESIGRMRIGTLIHNDLEYLIGKANFNEIREIMKENLDGKLNLERIDLSPVQSEQSVIYTNKKIKISGHYDQLVLLFNNLLVIDFKSTSAFAMKYVKKAVKEHHVEQLNVYMKMLGVKAGAIIYVNKDSYETATHVVAFDKDLFDKTVKKLENVYEHVLEKKVPTFDQEDWQCNYCNYKQECEMAKNNTLFVTRGLELNEDEIKINKDKEFDEFIGDY